MSNPHKTSSIMISNVAMKAVRAGKKMSLVRCYTVWSRNLSFASPATDFYHNSSAHHESDSSLPNWSHSLSFASPESDFATSTVALDVETSTKGGEWSGMMSFASPESDFQAVPFPTFRQELDHEQAMALKSSQVMGLAISSPESAFGFLHANQLLKDIQMYELYEHREKPQDEEPLPQTLQDAVSEDDRRAIVVTEAEAPFRVVEVNDAWIALCGYTKQEARHHSLSMIQGPDTNNTELKSMVQLLLAGQRAETLVTNYTKMGRKFYNHVRAGPIFNADKKITHFVGVLEEVTEQPDYFQIAKV